MAGVDCRKNIKINEQRLLAACLGTPFIYSHRSALLASSVLSMAVPIVCMLFSLHLERYNIPGNSVYQVTKLSKMVTIQL